MVRGTIMNEYKEFAFGPIPSKVIYDDSGIPQGFTCGETTYGFVRNLQGDVIAMVDFEGNIVMEYSYDPWGNIEYHLDDSLTEEEAIIFTALCPLTYRGYNYDFTTGLYYLQSRYYNPEWGRFLNCDDTAILLATQGETHNANLFAYCANNPVCNIDPTGYKEYTDEELLKITIVAAIFIWAIPYDSNYSILISEESEFVYFDYDIDRHDLIYARLASYDKIDKKYYTGRILVGEKDSWESYMNYDSRRRKSWNRDLWAFIYNGLDVKHEYSSTTAKIADGLSSLAYLATGAVVWGIGHGVIALTNSNGAVKNENIDLSNAIGMVAFTPIDSFTTKAAAWISISTNLKPRTYERFVIIV